jgi:hypothetical protein
MAYNFHGLISSTKLNPWPPFRFCRGVWDVNHQPCVADHERSHSSSRSPLLPYSLAGYVKFLQAGNIEGLSWRQQVAQGGVNTNAL